jgi:Wzt C-terminal domain
MQRLRERTQLDSELYSYARKLFAERFERIQQYSSPLENKHEAFHRQPAAGFESHVRRFVPFPLPFPVQREVEIRKVAAEWEPAEQHQTMRITVDYHAAEQRKELMAGILLHDADGAVVYGTNTMLEGIALEISAEGEGQVQFLLSCDLRSGLYSVTAALAHPWQTGAHYDWIDRATMCQLQVNGVHPSGCVRLLRVESKRLPTHARPHPPLAPATSGLR